MNMSKVVSAMKMQLGLHNITLPFKDSITGEPLPVENVMMEVLTGVTIPIYSQYQPWIREKVVNINSLRVIDRRHGIYVLPPELTDPPIIAVYDIYPPVAGVNYGMYGNINPSTGIGMVAQAIITGTAHSMLASQMRSEPTFEYMGENKIQLNGYSGIDYVFRVACVHEDNGESIPETCFASFMQLAKLDMQEFLYNNLKYYDNIPSAFGNVQLKTEDYTAAAGERMNLLEKWEDTWHLDMSFETWM